MSFRNYMLAAIDQAKLALEKAEVPVGCVIVYDNQIIVRSHNLVEENNLSIAHAEIIAITEASKIIGNKNLSSCDIYVTLEPCAMCSSAIAHSRIRRLFYGASDVKHGAVENGIRFFNTDSCFHKPEIYPGIEAETTRGIIQNFFKKLRKNKI